MSNNISGGPRPVVVPTQTQTQASPTEATNETDLVRTGVNYAREGFGTASAIRQGVVAFVSAQDPEKVGEFIKNVGKGFTAVGVVTNAAALRTKVENMVEAAKQGEYGDATQKMIVVVGGAADTAKGLANLGVDGLKKYVPGLKVLGMGGDLMSLKDAIQNPNASLTHVIASGTAVAADALSAAAPVIVPMAATAVAIAVPAAAPFIAANMPAIVVASEAGLSAISAGANAVAAHESQKELEAAHAPPNHSNISASDVPSPG